MGKIEEVGEMGEIEEIGQIAESGGSLKILSIKGPRIVYALSFRAINAVKSRGMEMPRIDVIPSDERSEESRKWRNRLHITKISRSVSPG